MQSEKKKQADKRYRTKHSERIKEKKKIVYENNKEKILESNNEYYQKNKETIILYKRKHRIKKYGITLEQYDEMFNLQKGCCTICGKHQDEFKKALSVDHCHETNKIRGLLCGKCNSLLRYANDNIDILNNAITYLTE